MRLPPSRASRRPARQPTIAPKAPSICVYSFQ